MAAAAADDTKSDKGAFAYPEVAAAPNTTYAAVVKGKEQVHEQESIFGVKYHWKGLKCQYDKLGNHFHDWRHDLLRRIIRVGGTPDSGIGTKTEDDVRKAYETTLDMLADINKKVADAFTVAMDKQDHPTIKMLMAIQHGVDCNAAKIQARLRQIDDLGEQFLITVAT